MIPKINEELQKGFEIREDPYETFLINTDKSRITGMCDGKSAVKQAIYLILNTQRYEHIIFSWSYGIETVDLVGKDTTFVLPELKRRVKEALTQDDRILDVSAFDFSVSRRKVHATFVVRTIYGDIEAEKEVSI